MKHSYLDILDEVKQKYGDRLNDKLISLKITQSDEGCYLHSEYSDEPGCLYIEELDIISDDDLIPLSEVLNPSFFNPNLGIEENARRFIEELDEYTIMMCFNKIIL